jgi:hypothetical protein
VIWSNLELIDIADTIGDLIDKAIDFIVDTLLGPLPDWVKDIVEAIFHGVSHFIRALLNLPVDLQNWLSTLLRTSLDLWDLLIQVIANHFQDKIVLASFDDPMEIMAQAPGPPLLPRVTAPIADLQVAFQPSELVMGVTA